MLKGIYLTAIWRSNHKKNDSEIKYSASERSRISWPGLKCFICSSSYDGFFLIFFFVCVSPFYGAYVFYQKALKMLF